MEEQKLVVEDQSAAGLGKRASDRENGASVPAGTEICMSPALTTDTCIHRGLFWSLFVPST